VSAGSSKVTAQCIGPAAAGHALPIPKLPPPTDPFGSQEIVAGSTLLSSNRAKFAPWLDISAALVSTIPREVIPSIVIRPPFTNGW
jgi:hypothetical protein